MCCPALVMLPPSVVAAADDVGGGGSQLCFTWPRASTIWGLILLNEGPAFNGPIKNYSSPPVLF